ncbi:hypothetical protein MycrhN_2553 [Mycolicibacterium rhodesiae NBB3]|uniref:Uncharacterized protein n=2 Tax=Mycolicibacterium rhodesiae TaxID=36814 RepID=G8RX90_MYCRN|nr:hypothetical protein MycrhN_2553 [Mycolicibacterium rhodesiae NBB3]
MSRTMALSPPVGVELSKVPTLKGKHEAHQWITEMLGVRITYNYFLTQCNAKRVPRTKIAGALFFSTADLYEWVMGQGDQSE